MWIRLKRDGLELETGKAAKILKWDYHQFSSNGIFHKIHKPSNFIRGYPMTSWKAPAEAPPGWRNALVRWKGRWQGFGCWAGAQDLATGATVVGPGIDADKKR